MRVFPANKIIFDQSKTAEIKHIVESTLRLITFSRNHLADDLLNNYLDKTLKLKDLVSIKNAQLEAENEDEIEEYVKLLRRAMEFITEEVLENHCLNSELQLFQLFRLISPDAHEKHPNKYRSQVVQIGKYLCPDPSEVASSVSEVFYQMKQITNPIIRSIYFHHELIRIHPFVDGNGRTVRMAKNWILLYELYPPMFMSDFKEKKIYIETLEKSFLQLNHQPDEWNEHLNDFFNHELFRLRRSALEVYDKISKIGKQRNKS